MVEVCTARARSARGQLVALCLCVVAGHALAAVAPSSPAQASTSPSTVAPLRLPANTHVELEVAEGVSSRTATRGANFGLRVRQDVVVDGRVVVPAGTKGVGQVVHAQRKGIGGKPGELIVAARRLDLPGGPVRLRSTFGAAGEARIGAAVATSVAFGVLGLLVKGSDTELPAGTALSARTSEDYPATVSAAPGNTVTTEASTP
jgi:hypothetical protein